MQITIDAKLKAKCPRTALACVTARVEAGASPAALLEEMKMRENEIQKLPFPRGVLASPQVEATRAASGRNLQRHRQIRFESRGIALVRRYCRATRQRDERFGADDGDICDETSAGD